MRKEQGAEYYNSAYKDRPEYAKPYKESPYYQMWLRLMGLIPNEATIVDVGCGTGQFAEMVLYYKNCKYTGIDFSQQAINMANSIVGDKCLVADLYEYHIDKTDFVICLETLEHIDDMRFLSRIPKGTQILFTVPEFDDPAHVRYFKTLNDVVARYNDKVLFTFAEKFDRWFIGKGVIK